MHSNDGRGKVVGMWPHSKQHSSQGAQTFLKKCQAACIFSRQTVPEKKTTKKLELYKWQERGNEKLTHAVA